MEQIRLAKARPATQGIRLTNRCKEILQFVERYQFATAEEIRVTFWRGKKTHNHYRTLRRLCRYGLLEPLKGTGESVRVYRLGKPTNRFLASAGLVHEQKRIRRLSYTSPFEHDKKLRLVRQVFEGCPIIRDFVPSHVLEIELGEKYRSIEEKRLGYKVPDALFSIKTYSGEWAAAALELELRLKSRARYAESFSRMFNRLSVKAFFFVFLSESQISLFERCLSNLCKQNPNLNAARLRHQFYYTTVGSLLSQGKEAEWKGEGKTFSLSSLEINRK